MPYVCLSEDTNHHEFVITVDESGIERGGIAHCACGARAVFLDDHQWTDYMKLRTSQSSNGVVTTVNTHWDCECEHNYIHPAESKVCHRCGCEREEQPDSRYLEVRLGENICKKERESRLLGHSPLPWEIGQGMYRKRTNDYPPVITSGSRDICVLETYFGDGEANAELITKACNSYYKMRDALVWFLDESADNQSGSDNAWLVNAAQEVFRNAILASRGHEERCLSEDKA